MRSIRGRLTLGVFVVLALVLGTAVLLIERQISRTEQASFDDRLRRTAVLSQAGSANLFSEGLPARVDRQLDAVLTATATSFRVTFGTRRVVEAGIPRPAGLPLDPPVGLHTYEAGGTRYRILTERLTDRDLRGLARIELVSSMAALDRADRDRERWLAAVYVGTLMIAGIGTWLTAQLILRPLARLRNATGRIEAHDDLDTRVPEDDGPAELRSLARSFNGMLAGLHASAADRERALAATRRFAADAGHELRTPLTAIGATISILGRRGLSDDQRAELAADGTAQQRRLVTLLDGLQALARGEVQAQDFTTVDLADIAAEVAALLDGLHPDAEIELDLPAAAEVVGWEPGLRMIVDNLVRNAIVHGGRPPRAYVGVVPVAAGTTLIVEDNGPGIDVEIRERVFEPFVRGGDEDRPGSGLGLALVAQQIRDHGATIEIARGERLGGCRIVVRLPTGSAVAATSIDSGHRDS